MGLCTVLMEKKMEKWKLLHYHRVYAGDMNRVYIGIMEKRMQTTIV